MMPLAAARLLCSFTARFMKKPILPVCPPNNFVMLATRSYDVLLFSKGPYCVLLVGALATRLPVPENTNDGTRSCCTASGNSIGKPVNPSAERPRLFGLSA